MEFEYPRSDHDVAFDEVFGSEPAGATENGSIDCIIMAFVNRSGSNHIAEVLKTTGRFVGFDEILNGYTIRYLAAQYKVGNFPAYLSRIYSEQTTSAGQIWGFKSSWQQLAMLLRLQAIGKLLRPSVVLVRRRDVVGQAISFLIAEQSKRWSTLESQGSEEIVYDGPRILSHIMSIFDSNAMLENILTLAGLPTFTVIYEDFLDRPHDIVCQVGLALGGQALIPQLGNLKLSVQRNETNDEFRRRFMSDVACMRWIGR